MAGVSAAVLEGGERFGGGGERITSLYAGLSHRSGSAPMSSATWLQQASLSKTVGAAYMVSYYQARGGPLSTPVVEILHRLQSPMILEVSIPTIVPDDAETACKPFPDPGNRPAILLLWPPRILDAGFFG